MVSLANLVKIISRHREAASISATVPSRSYTVIPTMRLMCDDRHAMVEIVLRMVIETYSPRRCARDTIKRGNPISRAPI